jgi:GTPase SAR1 family protein
VLSILNQNLQRLRANLEELVKDLHNLTIRIGAEELSTLVSDLRNRLHEPYMFVIVGEVKAGKSSFINALLSTGKEICRVAPQPMTDTIQQVMYGEREETIIINPHLKKILQPVDILREIAIVDTPGTNTIVQHHQEITERFIPASDLIVFVFEAKNPYRQSAWDFFDFIHQDWRKKIVFVLQQKDLLSYNDLKVNETGVYEYAQKKGVSEPKVFSVSAKMELEGQPGESGFGDVRQYIRENITGGKAPLLKIENNLTTTENISSRIRKGLDIRREQYQADLEFRKDIHDTLQAQEQVPKKQVEMLVENLIAGYDRITGSKLQELEDELSVFGLLKRSFASIFDKKASIKAWSDRFTIDLERDLQTELSSKLTTHVSDLADSIQQMAKIIDMKIQTSQTILRDSHEIFSDIAERRSRILRDLQEAFANFINRPENFSGRELFSGKEALSPNLLTGSGLAVIGTILMTVAHGMVFDITGGILTTVGILFAGISTSVKRKQILAGFRQEIAKGRAQFEGEVSEKLKNYVSMIRSGLEKNFENFDRMLESEEKQLHTLDSEFASITSRLGSYQAEARELQH